MFQYRVIEVPGESLCHHGFVMKGNGEFAEGVEAVGIGRIAFAGGFQRISRCGETAVVIGPHDHRADVGVHQFVGGGQHIEYRQPRLALGNPRLCVRILGFVIDHRMTACGFAGGGQTHFEFRHLAAIKPRFQRLHVDHGKQAVAVVAGAGFSTELRAVADHQESTFLGRIKAVGLLFARCGQAAGVATNVAGIGSD